MNSKYKESSLKIKLGNVVSEGQVENQYKKVGYKNITKESIEDTTKEINDYFSKLEQNSSNPSDKLVLIFPKYEEYKIAASLIWFFEINARVFTSVTDCVSVMNSLSNSGKKYSQIYIGSHGGGQEGLLSSIDEKEKTTLNGNFTNSLKKLIKPNRTSIFFSACRGANYNAYFMKQFAEETNTFVYASEGDFNWVLNKSEGGVWMCPPLPKVNWDSIWEYSDLMSMKYCGCKRTNSTPFDWM